MGGIGKLTPELSSPGLQIGTFIGTFTAHGVEEKPRGGVRRRGRKMCESRQSAAERIDIGLGFGAGRLKAGLARNVNGIENPTGQLKVTPRRG
jgi:hypothetical protein